ncbi:MAG: CDP-diacylglycerol--serine O-phosphatidyltransferase [candidate division Zixibacteria bacterium]|nr:CDP-diacylglycerol--serine O-phosphatidyltransferase [candidate division Zixibacteria bacterium]MDD5425016.1 CDP-diacylglycerol--serine O-phosphatidyltransferase [candidate division Zixibacteria bacterium]
MPKYRGIFPGTFTMGNVVCGFIAILTTFEGHITTACWFVILAAFLDALDGKVARLSGSASQFGVELDSLADFLSFGVAPAFLVYATKFSSLGKWGWVPPIVFIMAAAYRLARFNLLADTEEKRDFIGLPVPMAALTVVSFIIFSYNLWENLRYGEILISIIILLSFLMVSQIQYDTIPDRYDRLSDRIKLVILLIAGVAIIFSPRLLLFPIISLYILYGMIREFYRLFHVGVDKVSAHSYRRRQNKGFSDDEQEI